MPDFSSFKVDSIDVFKKKLVTWANAFPVFTFLDSHHFANDPYHKYDFLIGIDALNFSLDIEELKEKSFVFGYFGYDYKEVQPPPSSPFVDFGSSFFFEPRYILYSQQGRIFINRNMMEAMQIMDAIAQMDIFPYQIPSLKFHPRTNQEEYQERVERVQEDIRNGRYYELNYCVEFYNEAADIHPIASFFEINKVAQAPMSALVKREHRWALSFSPERLLCLRGHVMASQPMKGTARRCLDDAQVDSEIKKDLENSTKERAENMMIADLMRHDMTPFADLGSIQAREICKVYSFAFVHQMISTIEATLKNPLDKWKALKNTIPAGSMTGAPKREVMKAIAEMENFHRGMYAGNIGYVDMDGDFDFNVVIRTLFYDDKSKKIGLNVGGAITLLSDSEKEYHECLLKAEGILKFFE